MRELGLAALAESMTRLVFHDMLAEYGHLHPDLAVLHAAHAGEILIKAAIAEKHPLLVFEQIPQLNSNTQVEAMKELMEKGRTYQYFELPQILFAATGYRIAEIEVYRKFGRLRNQIQHFSTPSGIDLHSESLNFIFKVIDPLIRNRWNKFAVHHCNEDEFHRYVFTPLLANNIEFAHDPDCEECIAGIDEARAELQRRQA